jgi:hypothetical protein
MTDQAIALAAIQAPPIGPEVDDNGAQAGHPDLDRAEGRRIMTSTRSFMICLFINKHDPNYFI